jgi:glycosyltransferase involved in cell wall biosynthesis
MKINIIARENSAGLSADIHIIKKILTDQNWQVDFSDYKSLTRFSPWKYKHYDLNVFLQWANPTWLKLAKKNIFIPNQECFKLKWLGNLHKFDAIFCKTKHAAKIFEDKNKNIVYTSFTSLNKNQIDMQKKPDRWLHVAGNSKMKGTEVILKTWMANPHFPHLTVVQRRREYSTEYQASNLSCISEYISEDRISELMNTCSVHICTSIAEGFGHYIAESLSCGSLVISTDAPPMNELITKKRGFLVAPYKRESMGLSHAYFINQQSLEETVQQVLNTPGHSFLMNEGKAFYIANDRFFKQQFLKEIRSVIS